MDQIELKQALTNTIQIKSDQCVRCGLCIPHCPTYHISALECESPRGRIALFNAYANGALPATPKMLSYLDHCLSCNACEAVCPSEVEYSQILTAGKALLTQQGDANHLPFSAKLILWLANFSRYPFIYSFLTYLFRFYQVSKLQTLLRKTKLLKLFKLEQLDDYLTPPISIQSFKRFYKAKDAIGSIGLFTGCISRLIDKETLLATIKLLNHYRYDVHIPQNQACCGALQKHAGFIENSQILFKQNSSAFADLNTIITVASGCGASLHQLAHINNFPKVMDPFAFFATQENQPVFKTLSKKIAVHIPCTLKNVLQQDDGLITLLKKISTTEISILKTPYCCGAAGMNMIQNIEDAEKLADNLIDEIVEIAPDVVVTSNIGCELHLLQRSKKIGKSLEIIHPCVLLAACI